MIKWSKPIFIFVISLMLNTLNSLYTMDDGSAKLPEKPSTLRQSMNSFVAFCGNLPGLLLGNTKSAYSGPDHFSDLPDHIILECILQEAITAFDLSDYHGVKAAISWLIQLRKTNRRFRDMLSNNQIAHMIKTSNANLNDTNIYDLGFDDLSLWERISKAYEMRPLPSNQYDLKMPHYYSLDHHTPNSIPDQTTLITWAAKKGHRNLAQILVKAGAQIPQPLIPRLQDLGIDIATTPEK